MLIRSLLTPVNKLTTLGLNDTVKSAIDIIEENGFLSLPVTDDDKFIGFLSLQGFILGLKHKVPTSKES